MDFMSTMLRVWLSYGRYVYNLGHFIFEKTAVACYYEAIECYLWKIQYSRSQYRAAVNKYMGSYRL